MHSAKMFDETIPVMEAHGHICFPEPVNESVERYEALFRQLKIGAAGLLACPICDHSENGRDILENLKCLYLKDRLTLPVYANASIDTYGKTPEDYAAFARRMQELGFDGFKSLEQHPKNRKLAGKGLNDPAYAAFFEELDRKGLPIVCHIGDPANNWELSTATESAIELGRVYGPGFCSLQQLYGEMEEVIARYPNVKFILAHFYFSSDDYAHACRMMEYPNVYFDLTPGSEMFVNFSKDVALWRAFFLKHSKRLILGSDQYAKGLGTVRYCLARNFLEGTEPFLWREKTVIPIHLPREVLEDIYRNNALSLLGQEPKPVNRKLAYEYCYELWQQKQGELSELGKENLKVMMEYWRNDCECL